MASCPGQTPLCPVDRPREGLPTPKFHRGSENEMVLISHLFAEIRHTATPTSYFRYRGVLAPSRRDNAFRVSLHPVVRRDPPRPRVVPTQWASISHRRKVCAIIDVGACARTLGSGVSPSSRDARASPSRLGTWGIPHGHPSSHALPRKRYNPLMHRVAMWLYSTVRLRTIHETSSHAGELIYQAEHRRTSKNIKLHNIYTYEPNPIPRNICENT